MNEKAYRQLKQEAESAKADAERAQGSLEQLTKQLHQEFGCSTPKETKTKLEELREEKEQAEKAFNKALAEYEKEWT